MLSRRIQSSSTWPAAELMGRIVAPLQLFCHALQAEAASAGREFLSVREQGRCQWLPFLQGAMNLSSQRQLLGFR